MVEMQRSTTKAHAESGAVMQEPWLLKPYDFVGEAAARPGKRSAIAAVSIVRPLEGLWGSVHLPLVFCRCPAPPQLCSSVPCGGIGAVEKSRAAGSGQLRRPVWRDRCCWGVRCNGVGVVGKYSVAESVLLRSPG